MMIFLHCQKPQEVIPNQSMNQSINQPFFIKCEMGVSLKKCIDVGCG